MHSSVRLVVWVFGSYLLFKLLSFLNSERRHRAQAREWGCEDPPSVQGDPLGVDLVRAVLKADRDCRLPASLKERNDGVSMKHGRQVETMVVRLFGKRIVHTTDPANIQAVLATKFKDYELGDMREKIMGPLFGNGIFISNGKRWEHSRALLRPQFAREQLSQVDLEEAHLQNMMKVLRVNPDGWTDLIDIQPLFFRLTIDSATEFLFGRSVESQLAGLPGHPQPKDVPTMDEKSFAYFFDKSQAEMARLGRYGPVYWLFETKESRRLYKQCHNFIDHFVQLGLSKEKSPESESESKKYVFLDALTETTRDPIVLRDELSNILLAGRDTTASLLSFVFIMLIQNPRVFSKLRTIILENFGTYSHPKNLSFADLKGCSYLQWTLNETLRLYPVVPFNDRHAISTTTLPRGGGPNGTSPIYIRAGDIVDYSVYCMHRSREHWGPDADVFRPERWDGRRSGWEYLPFNGGPRICIGQQFALTEAGYVVVRLLQRFEGLSGEGNSWEEEPKGKGYVRVSCTLTMSPADGVKVRLREATE